MQLSTCEMTQSYIYIWQKSALILMGACACTDLELLAAEAAVSQLPKDGAHGVATSAEEHIGTATIRDTIVKPLIPSWLCACEDSNDKYHVFWP